jgi:formylglycine-generating enzyme required for sulfatase activity
MAGNVWEWTSSLYQDYPYQADAGREAPTLSSLYMLRGGSWNNRSYIVRSADRYWDNPGDRHIYVGFRCASAIRSP